MMRTLTRITTNIWKYRGKSNIYILQDDGIAIDAGDRADNQEIRFYLPRIITSKPIKKVIFTHLHYDHIGNFDIFSGSEFFASREAILDLEKSPLNTILDQEMVQRFKKVKLKSAPEKIGPLSVIHTPGHTRGSICLWHEKEKILFSGDTIFKKRNIGRTDLPTSSPDKIQGSIIRLIDYPFTTLCPGHDY